MFWHLYKYRLKVLLNNKYLLFWLGMFPIILGTFFNMAFSDITDMTENINTIKVVITTDASYDEDVKEIVNSDESFATFIEEIKNRDMFEVSYEKYEKATEILSNGEADGTLVLKKGGQGLDMEILFKSSGMNQTIFKNIINIYRHGQEVIEEAIKNNPQNISSVIDELYNDESLLKDITGSSKNMDTYNQYYFALFAMTCMFGATLGMFNTQHCQADQSAVAMRRAASPTKKMMMVLSEYLAAVTIIELLFSVLVIYLTFVLKVDLGNKYVLIMFASFIASLFGVALGYFFGVAFKINYSAKEGMMMAFILFLNFLAGLMVGNMKYIIEKACPIVNRINPAAIISDCFYSICVYDDMDTYIRCVISIAIWAVILAVASITVLRREKYANL